MRPIRSSQDISDCNRGTVRTDGRLHEAHDAAIVQRYCPVQPELCPSSRPLLAESCIERTRSMTCSNSPSWDSESKRALNLGTTASARSRCHPSSWRNRWAKVADTKIQCRLLPYPKSLPIVAIACHTNYSAVQFRVHRSTVKS